MPKLRQIGITRNPQLSTSDKIRRCEESRHDPEQRQARCQAHGVQGNRMCRESVIRRESMKTDAHSHAARQATIRVVAGLVALVASCGRASSSAEVADAAKLVDLGQCEAAVDKLKVFVSAHPDDK